MAGTNGNGDGFVSIALDTPVLDNGAAGPTELNWCWYHLQLAELISGIPVTSSPNPEVLFSNQGKLSSSWLYFADFEWIGSVTVTNKMIRIQGNNSDKNPPTPAVRVADANQIDSKYDDGVPGTGEILAATYSDAAKCCDGNACTAANAVYGLPANASSASPYCGLLWQTE